MPEIKEHFDILSKIGEGMNAYTYTCIQKIAGRRGFFFSGPSCTLAYTGTCTRRCTCTCIVKIHAIIIIVYGSNLF